MQKMKREEADEEDEFQEQGPSSDVYNCLYN
jgi:hypothetical protein